MIFMIDIILKLKDIIIPIICTIISIVVGFSLFKFFEQKRYLINKQLDTIVLLLVYRNAPDHGNFKWNEALNSIPVYFHKNQNVIDTFHKFYDLLSDLKYTGLSNKIIFEELIEAMRNACELKLSGRILASTPYIAKSLEMSKATIDIIKT